MYRRIKIKFPIKLSALLSVWLSTHLLYAATLDVTISGFKNNAGSTLVYLHNQASSFPFPTQSQKALSFRQVKISNQSSSVTFDKLEPGTYAVSIIHDENKDGLLQTNFIGIPEEGVGVSKNVHGHFGPPSYQDASFQLNEHKHLNIKVHY